MDCKASSSHLQTITPEHLASEEPARLASIAFMEKRAAAAEKSKSKHHHNKKQKTVPHRAAACSVPSPPPSAPANAGQLSVTITSLRCNEGNEIGILDREDEVKMVAWSDGRNVGEMQNNDLRKGATWNIGRTFTASNEIRITVTELDTTGNDDLGALTFTRASPSADSGTLNINREGANYDVAYTRSWVATGEPAWRTALNAWAADSTGSVWSGINKADVVASVTNRLGNAMLVNQEDTPMCGPAAILFEMVKRAPQYYVEMMRALTSAGTWTSPFRLTVRASTRLRNGGRRPRVDPADWIAMASMRETENGIFNVDQNSNAFVMGISTPWEMKKWIEGMFGFQTDFDSTQAWGERDAVEKTNRAVTTQAGIGFFLVDSAIIGNPARIHYPDHWIVYRCCLSITGSGEYNIAFTIWTWGQDCQISTRKSPFEDAFFGTVIGHP